MAVLISNENAFGGTKIDLNGNSVTLTMGDSISVSVGMANAAYFGTKTQLVAGVATNINLGPSTTCTYGNILGSTYGNCWAWTAANNTTFDVATRWGATQNTFAGGVSDISYGLRFAEKLQGENLTMIILTSYILTIGLTLAGMQYPPFRMTGENSDGNATDVTPNSNAHMAFIIDGIGILLLAFMQCNTAQIYSSLKDFDPVSYMEYTNAGINCEVYKFPDTIPALLNVEVPKPAITATQNAKAGFYMRPYPGMIGPKVGNRTPYIPTAFARAPEYVPDIELLTTAGPGPLSFSQIHITPSKINIGAGIANIPDTDVISNAIARAGVTGPKVVLDNTTSSITLTNTIADPATNIAPNVITIDPLQTTIKRLAGKISISQGVLPAGSKLELDTTTGVTLASPLGSIAINPVLGDTTITARGVLVGSFSATTGIKLISGNGLMQITNLGLWYKGTLIQV